MKQPHTKEGTQRRKRRKIKIGMKKRTGSNTVSQKKKKQETKKQKHHTTTTSHYPLPSGPEPSLLLPATLVCMRR